MDKYKYQLNISKNISLNIHKILSKATEKHNTVELQ